MVNGRIEGLETQNEEEIFKILQYFQLTIKMVSHLWHLLKSYRSSDVVEFYPLKKTQVNLIDSSEDDY